MLQWAREQGCPWDGVTCRFIVVTWRALLSRPSNSNCFRRHILSAHSWSLERGAEVEGVELNDVETHALTGTERGGPLKRDAAKRAPARDEAAGPYLISMQGQGLAGAAPYDVASSALARH